MFLAEPYLKARYEAGYKQGIEQGIEEGREHGREEVGRQWRAWHERLIIEAKKRGIEFNEPPPDVFRNSK